MLLNKKRTNIVLVRNQVVDQDNVPPYLWPSWYALARIEMQFSLIDYSMMEQVRISLNISLDCINKQVEN